MTIRTMFGVMAATAALTTAAAAQTYNTPLSDEQIIQKYCEKSPRGIFMLEDARVPTHVFCGLREIRPMDPKTACESFEVAISGYDPRRKNVKNPAWSSMTMGEVYEKNRKAYDRYCTSDKLVLNPGSYAFGWWIG